VRRIGRGYVENWTTEAFASYVKERDVGGYIILARDHGGPFQGKDETLSKAYRMPIVFLVFALKWPSVVPGEYNIPPTSLSFT